MEHTRESVCVSGWLIWVLITDNVWWEIGGTCNLIPPASKIGVSRSEMQLSQLPLVFLPGCLLVDEHIATDIELPVS